MSTPFLKSFERSISVARLASYRKPDDGENDALARYLWNASLCESLHSPLQHLEIGFRNALHIALIAETGNQNWVSQADTSILQPKEVDSVTEAKRALIDRNRPTDEGYVVNELRFGFWASLLDSRYDRLWPPIIAKVFPNCPRRERTRSDISKIITRIRRLRNAAFHHHSIWHWHDLLTRHAEIHTVIGWICPSLAIVALKIDRFPSVAAAGETMHSSILNEITPPGNQSSMIDERIPAPHVKFVTTTTPQPETK